MARHHADKDPRWLHFPDELQVKENHYWLFIKNRVAYCIKHSVPRADGEVATSKGNDLSMNIKKTSPVKTMINTKSAPQQNNPMDQPTADTLARSNNLNLAETSSFLGPRSANQEIEIQDEEEPMSPIDINDWNTIYLSLKPAFEDKKRKRKEAEKADKVFKDRLTQLVHLSSVTDEQVLLKRLNN